MTNNGDFTVFNDDNDKENATKVVVNVVRAALKVAVDADTAAKNQLKAQLDDVANTVESKVKEFINGLATKGDLIDVATKEDLIPIATTEELKKFTKKADLADFNSIEKKDDLNTIVKKDDLNAIVKKDDLDVLATEDDLKTILKNILAEFKISRALSKNVRIRGQNLLKTSKSGYTDSSELAWPVLEGGRNVGEVPLQFNKEEEAEITDPNRQPITKTQFQTGVPIGKINVIKKAYGDQFPGYQNEREAQVVLQSFLTGI